MYVFITLLVIFLVLFSCACLYMTVCIDLCALTPPVCGLSFISIKFCSVLFCSKKTVYQNIIVIITCKKNTETVETI